MIYLLYQRVDVERGVNEYKINVKDQDWATVRQVALGDMKLLARMSNYEVKYLKKDNVAACDKIMAQLEKVRAASKDAPGMDQFIKSKSEAALGMFTWIRNTLKVYEIWRDVEPK